MSSGRRQEDYLHDILDYAGKAERFLAGLATAKDLGKDSIQRSTASTQERRREESSADNNASLQRLAVSGLRTTETEVRVQRTTGAENCGAWTEHGFL